MTDKAREALESIAGWRRVNISGEYEHGLRDIIRSITECAAAALEVIPNAAQSVGMREALEKIASENTHWSWTDEDTADLALAKIAVQMRNMARAALASQPSPAATVEIPGFTIDALRKQAFRMPPADQFKLACFIAENVGYVLAPEEEHPDSPHNGSSADSALLQKLADMIERGQCGDVWDINDVSEADHARLPTLLRRIA